YAFHQFWFNASDADVVNYLKYFTFRTREEIDELARITAEASHERRAQRALADDLTTLVHGERAAGQAAAAAGGLFGRGEVRELDDATLTAIARELPGAELPAVLSWSTPSSPAASSPPKEPPAAAQGRAACRSTDRRSGSMTSLMNSAI